MRISRHEHLNEQEAAIHLIWRCHNKEYYLASPTMRDLYMDIIKFSLEKKAEFRDNIKIHAYCVMSNHFHQYCTYKNGSKNLSNYMRYAHGIFGAKYNRIHRRSGKVAEARPKTPRIQNYEHEIYVHFYIEANPIRAGICKLHDLHTYKHNSYKFYAFGIQDEYTNILSIPDWYLDLGKTARERQKKYRQLFFEYIEDKEKMLNMAKLFVQEYIGGPIWCSEQLKNLKIRYKFKNTKPVDCS